MDYFERWFHVSPDSGDGTMEAAYLAVVLVAISARVMYFGIKKLRGCDPTSLRVGFKEGSVDSVPGDSAPQ